MVLENDTLRSGIWHKQTMKEFSHGMYAYVNIRRFLLSSMIQKNKKKMVNH